MPMESNLGNMMFRLGIVNSMAKIFEYKNSYAIRLENSGKIILDKNDQQLINTGATVELIRYKRNNNNMATANTCIEVKKSKLADNWQDCIKDEDN